MTASVLHEKSTDSAGGGGTLSISPTVAFTAGSALHVIATWGDNSAAPSISDGTNTYSSALDSFFNTDVGQSVCQFTANNIASGSPTITLTFTGTPAFTGLHIEEIGGVTTTAADGHNKQRQTFPGTGADGVSSTAVSNANQPALLVGHADEFGGTAGSPPTAGTGFTTGTTYFGFGGGALARSENKRITNTTGTAATFTSSTGTSTDCYGAMFDESGGAGFTAKFRKTLSGIGSRVGSRQLSGGLKYGLRYSTV